MAAQSAAAEREQAALALIRGETQGPGAGLLRGALWLASAGFGVAARARGWAYSAGLLRSHQPPVPTISVGNLTTGGTGKTPLVIALAEALLERGERVGILARGYGAERDGELNDELRLIQEVVPQALLFPGRDRLAKAWEAAAGGATALVLDDGFQHRRLGRDVDVVLLDACEPFGPGEHLLPRGLLREPPSALGRADVVVLSRVERRSEAELAELEARVRRLGFRGPLLRQRTVPAGVLTLDADAPRPVNLLADQPLLAACGIGNPTNFRASLEQLGAARVELIPFPDHHAYTAGDVRFLAERAQELGVERIVVTAKDWIKLRPLLQQSSPAEPPWAALTIRAELGAQVIVSRAFPDPPQER